MAANGGSVLDVLFTIQWRIRDVKFVTMDAVHKKLGSSVIGEHIGSDWCQLIERLKA